MNEPQTPQGGDMGEQDKIVVLTTDLFFGMRVRTTVKQLGYSVTITKDEAGTIDALAQQTPVLVLVDFNQPVDWPALAPLETAGVPVIAFGSHTDVEGFRAAKAASVSRVVSNGEFSRTLPALIAKYRNS
ncbi:MAG TPA: hypothetical protein VGR29_07410 [Thermomicrobiales bacterium]|nr:hypothetical protein [Thermomicrobiales bacterium]